ncbi:MAG: phospho-N-acetylmuramoyl-pentapeptide-transferase, partial [Oscillospiraceae bacterium]
MLLSITAAVLGFIISVVTAVLIIPILRKLKFGQTILEIGPAWHKSKQGTPTMGGLMFILAITASVIITYCVAVAKNPQNPVVRKDSINLFSGLIMALLFGMVGFIDDYIKVVKKQNLGLTASQKILFQVIITAVYLVSRYYLGNTSTVVNIPFFGQFDMGFLYYIVMGILIIGIVNSANLTDGVDGLLGSVTFVIAIFFIITTGILKLELSNIMACALAGALIGFLIFNLHPAKVFMGDTGSFFLGGLVVALAFSIDMPILLFFVGFIYC